MSPFSQTYFEGRGSRFAFSKLFFSGSTGPARPGVGLSVVSMFTIGNDTRFPFGLFLPFLAFQVEMIARVGIADAVVEHVV